MILQVRCKLTLLISILRLSMVLTEFLPCHAAATIFFLNRHTPLGQVPSLSGQSPVCRVTQLRTDGVHCRESAGTGPANLKVVPNECCLGRSPWTKKNAPLFPIPTIGMK